MSGSRGGESETAGRDGATAWPRRAEPATYQDKQKQLLQELEARFRRGDTAVNVAPVQDYAGDPRLCLASVLFLPPELQTAIERAIIAPLREADPVQYYYPPASLHLTIQNVRLAHDPPRFNDEDIAAARAVFQGVVPRHRAFAFELRGLLELPTSLAVCAYSPADLGHLVEALRAGLAAAGIADDKTYASLDVFFGNITVARYTGRPNARFLAQVSRLKDCAIGSLLVAAVTLISGNIACHPERTRRIETYRLRAPGAAGTG